MPRGDKSKYTGKQKRKAAKIEQGYRRKGISEDEAERRAWATVNKMDQGGKKPGGSGRGKAIDKSPAREGGRKGGRAKAARNSGRKTKR
ncbi:MAG: plasmid stabilization protein [Nitrospira sp. WS110]|nr:plasmid stabilization protein [Nitrospira sp. WS110]